jgi:hypothetical protein
MGCKCSLQNQIIPKIRAQLWAATPERMAEPGAKAGHVEAQDLLNIVKRPSCVLRLGLELTSNPQSQLDELAEAVIAREGHIGDTLANQRLRPDAVTKPPSDNIPFLADSQNVNAGTSVDVGLGRKRHSKHDVPALPSQPSARPPEQPTAPIEPASAAIPVPGSWDGAYGISPTQQSTIGGLQTTSNPPPQPPKGVELAPQTFR